jgi:chemotaxis protein methyltransferase CheR
MIAEKSDVSLNNDVQQKLSGYNLTDKQFRNLSSFIERDLGIKMPDSKKIMLESRLQKRVKALQLPSFKEYLDLVFSDEGRQSELLHMIDAVTTNKTDFFRESDHFDFLLHSLLPERTRTSGWGTRSPLRIWSAGCSSGEEPYTLTMVLENYKERNTSFQYKILATDISINMLKRAVQGIYTEERIAPVTMDFRKKYLLRSKDPRSGIVRIKPELRKRIIFYRLNLMDEVFDIKEKFEIIFCRNVIIYFDRNNQYKLLKKFYNHLVPGGYLFLGHSETITGLDIPFYSVAPTIYRRAD